MSYLCCNKTSVLSSNDRFKQKPITLTCLKLSSVLKRKYSLSTRNKCVYLLEASETSITIWRQEYSQNYYIQGVLWRKRHVEIY